jgi:Flp pilus assembly secretin CpaC
MGFFGDDLDGIVWPGALEIGMTSKTGRRAIRLPIGRAAWLALPICALIGHVAVAVAEPAPVVTVKADQATLVALAGEPATVLVGNSLFADVTLEKGMIVIHGRHFGTTNVIVLDKQNDELANFELTVVRGGSKNVTVRKGISTFSYLCAPSCENALQVGDNADYFSSVSSAMSTKLQLSTGAGHLSE